MHDDSNLTGKLVQCCFLGPTAIYDNQSHKFLHVEKAGNYVVLVTATEHSNRHITGFNKHGKLVEFGLSIEERLNSKVLT